MGILTLAVLMYCCANVVSPTGGPIDEEPPVVVRSQPPNYSPNFSGGEVRIYFDEFVELRDLRQQLLISPPLQTNPEVRIRGRSIVFSVDEDLRQNTTYSIFFGDAIRDITEGNPIPNYQFVFSTGDYVDSLSVSGLVVDAFTLEPAEGVYVMMYDSIVDSIPYLERPVYLAKTGSEGRFSIGNIREGEYLIFGLVDNNANFLYDLPDEKIAFLDSLVRPRYLEPPPAPDPDAREEEDPGDGEETRETREGPGAPSTPLRDQYARETPEGPGAPPDTTALPQELPGSLSLFLFQEADTVQRITSSEAVSAGRIRLVFRVPFDSLQIRDFRQELPDHWHLAEESSGRDTLTLWLPEPRPDSLFLEISDREHILDTLTLSTRPRQARARAGEEAITDPAPAQVQLTMRALRSGRWPYYEPLSLMASAPVDSLDLSRITLVQNDSIPLEPGFVFDGPVQRSFRLDFELEEEQAYAIEFLPGAVTDIFGGRNDTIRRSFTTTAESDYGKLFMNIELPQKEQVYILQLLDKDGKILQEMPANESRIYRFADLNPGNYGLRLIEDLNNNGKWDPGIYLKGILPEPVYMYPDPLQIRQNWELEMPWNP